jgi:hypothetical protein
VERGRPEATYLTAGVAAPNTACIPTPLELLQLFHFYFLLMMWCILAHHEDMCHFLALIQRMCPYQHATSKQYWSRKPMCHAPFYPHAMQSHPPIPTFWKWGAPDRNKECYDRCWKLKRIFSYLNARYADVYSPCDRWRNRKIIREGGFPPVHSKNRKWYGIKLYQLCDSLVYTHYMNRGADQVHAPSHNSWPA